MQLETQQEGASPQDEVLNPDYLVQPDTPDTQAPRLDFAGILRESGPTAEQLGRVVRAHGNTVHVTGIEAGIGHRCVIETPGVSEPCYGDVVGIIDSRIVLYLLGSVEGISNRSTVKTVPAGRSIGFSPELIGCVLDGLGNLLYSPREQIDFAQSLKIDRAAPDALTRASIERVFSTGIKAVDALLTVGVGQRMGIFAAAGGGKSTLLSMLARNSDADVIVIGMIGERGREVREFIAGNLGAEGMAKAVVVVSTSDRPAMERVTAAQSATAIAEGFRAQGKRVLLLIDSITRYARALREIGLSVGEPPVRRGFPPSVFADLPRLLERAGNDRQGSITAFYTILTEDEDGTDPVAEEVRSILDGHIVLSRELAERGHYPPIDVLASTSRLFPSLVNRLQGDKANRVRELMARYREIELLIQMGEYTAGNDQTADDAVQGKPLIEQLLRQRADESVSFDRAVEQMMAIG